MLKLLVEHEMVLASKKSPADIVCHAGNLRKSAAGAQAAIHASSKSATIAKPAAGKHHPAAEPPTSVEKPAAAEPAAGVDKPAAAEPPAGVEKPATTEPPPPLRMVATFDNYTTKLDDGSNVLVKAHDVDVYVDR
jgi:cytoskeletal protein RodZ